jgi:hypothetical protein
MYLFYRNIALGFITIAFGISGIRYCIGWPKFRTEKEEKRIDRVKKYGLLIFLFSIALIANGVHLLFLALKIN